MALEEFSAFTKANDIFDVVVEDMRRLQHLRALDRLVAQQLASADSIAANIEEGYGRHSQKEFCQFLIVARGSAQETRGRYHRMRHWLSAEKTAARQALCDEIIGMLTATIQTLKK
ncbi:MAG: four helix bundle protein [Verrucomicrobiota bacterium]